MRQLAVSIAILLSSLASCGARAGTAELNWTPVNGATYNIYAGRSPTSMSKVMSGLTDTRIVWSGPNVMPNYWYTIKSVVNGVESPVGEVIQMATPAPIMPIENVTAKKATTSIAYYMIQTADKYIALPVGTIAIGLACDATQSVNGFNVIPRASVTWYGTVKPLVTVTKCG